MYTKSACSGLKGPIDIEFRRSSYDLKKSGIYQDGEIKDSSAEIYEMRKESKKVGS